MEGVELNSFERNGMGKKGMEWNWMEWNGWNVMYRSGLDWNGVGFAMEWKKIRGEPQLPVNLDL